MEEDVCNFILQPVMKDCLLYAKESGLFPVMDKGVGKNCKRGKYTIRFFFKYYSHGLLKKEFDDGKAGGSDFRKPSL